MPGPQALADGTDGLAAVAGLNFMIVKAGDQVTVTLYPAKNGKPEGVLAKMVTANGKEWCCETK